MTHIKNILRDLNYNHFKTEDMIQPAMTDGSLMPFGKYKGKALANIPAHYLLWLHDNGVTHNGVKQYINQNLQALNKEAARTKR